MSTQQAAQSPQEQVIGLVFALIQSRAMTTAVELGIADVLAEGALEVEEIAKRTSTNPGNLFRLMRALEIIGIFRQKSPRVFENTPMSECLRRDVPGSQWALVKLMAPGWGTWEGCREMTRTVEAGRTVVFDEWGNDYWGHFRNHPEQWPVFNEAMRSITYPMTGAVTAAYDWSRFPVIADVAGGIGVQLASILDANPGCRGVLFDQSEVLEEAIPHDRIERVAGNFFKEIPVEADAYILRNIIHDWEDPDALRILKTVRTAAKPSSKIMLIEWHIPETSEPHFGKWTDLVMMSAVGGRERTRTEFERLYGDSGFKLEEIVPTESMFSIVVGHPVKYLGDE